MDCWDNETPPSYSLFAPRRYCCIGEIEVAVASFETHTHRLSAYFPVPILGS